MLPTFCIQYWNRFRCWLCFSGLVRGIITQEYVLASLDVASAGLGWKRQHDGLGESLPKTAGDPWRGWGSVPGTEESIAPPTSQKVNLVTTPWGKGVQMPSSAADFGFSLSYLLFVPQKNKAKYSICLKENGLSEIFQAGLLRKWGFCPSGSPLLCQSVFLITF